MTSFTFDMPVTIYHEEGALARCGTTARGFGRRCFIMTSGSAAERSGALKTALDSMKAAGVEATVFPLITANPTVRQCRAAVDAIKASFSHSILAIGGGSVMDAAKATAWLAYNHVRDAEELFSAKLKREAMPLMLCGTTAGTGSEVSGVAVITDDNGKKRSVKHRRCFAEYVFADARYTDSCPRDITVSTALDALAHAVEGYLNPACDDVSTMFAEKALPMITGELAALCDNELPDKNGRDRLFDGALYAGFVLNACGTAFPHPMGYVLTEEHGIPHGQACAVFMPALLDCAKAASPDRAARLFTLCGGEETLRRILSTLVSADVHMSEEQLTACAERFAALPHFARVPGGFDGERAASLCRRLFG